MSGGWVVREALARDVAGVMALERATPELAHWSEAQYAAMLSGRDGALARQVLVAVRGAHVVGFVAGRYLDGEPAAEIESLAVEPGMRRGGVASALLLAFTEWAWSTCGAEGLSLEVRASNAVAKRFYERTGFYEVATRAGYYREPVEDAAVLAKAFWETPSNGDL